ncbi:MAG TPA: D-aminoacylase [bacterium]|nr:D-aminoacylase [bacterium]
MKRRQFIKKTAWSAVFASNLLIKGCVESKEYDILITGGLVYDGLGAPGREADIALKNNRIVKIAGEIRKSKALEVVDARGMAVAPGFIDPHTHSDVQLLANPRAESKIRQGVTTEIGGNCGFTYFPLSDRSYEENRKLLERRYSVELTWKEMKGFFNRLEESGMALNFATLLGHGNLRDAVMGPYDRPPSDKELKSMKQIVREHLKAGVLGLSTGLEYTPGSFAKTDELVELCRDVAELNGVYATHIRSEQDLVLEAIDEAIAISRETGVSLQISHIKANYKKNWSKISDILQKIEAAKDNGVPILADRYPYNASSTGLNSFFPLWAREGTNADFVARLKDKSLEGKLKAHIKEMGEKMETWDNVLLSSVLTDINKHLEGKTVLKAAIESKKTPYEFMRDLLIDEDGQVGMVKFGMSEDNLRQVLAHPLVVIGSDGNAVAPYGSLSKDKPHPRFYGTFPRVLGRYVRDENILSLQEAVRRMTSLTADKFGLAERGRITEGCYADIVIFNPDTVIDRATYEDPHRYPEGIIYVIVNGQIVINNGEHTGKLPGRILRKQVV